MAADPRPPDPNRPSQSFKDAVVRPSIPIMEATERKLGTTFKGEPALQFSQEEIAKLAAPFAHTLIGKFALQRPNLAFLRKGFQLIGFTGEVDIGVLDAHHVLLRFSHNEDYYRVWMRGSWNFKQHVMRILKWTPDFTCHQEPAIAPVWAAFNHLPIHLFQQGPLLSLASLIGRPLRIDSATKNLSRPSTARVCIEVNLLRALPKRIWIGHGDTGFWQSVHYESLPQYCTQCFSIGHASIHCKTPEQSHSEEEQLINKQIWKKKEIASASGLTNKEKETIPTDISISAMPATLAPKVTPQVANEPVALDNPVAEAVASTASPIAEIQRDQTAAGEVPEAETQIFDAVAGEAMNRKTAAPMDEPLQTKIAPESLAKNRFESIERVGIESFRFDSNRECGTESRKFCTELIRTENVETDSIENVRTELIVNVGTDSKENVGTEDVTLEDDTDSIENIIPDKSPLTRSASATLSRPNPQENTDDEATMSQPDATDEEGEWNLAVPRRRRQKKDYGRSAMITRSQESPSFPPDE